MHWVFCDNMLQLLSFYIYLVVFYMLSVDFSKLCSGVLVFVEIRSNKGRHVINLSVMSPLTCLITELFCDWANSGYRFSPASGIVFYLYVEVWNINSMRETCCNNTINLLKIYYCKIKVLCFVIKRGRKLTIGVKFEVNVIKRVRGSCSCCFFDLFFFGGILMESS